MNACCARLFQKTDSKLQKEPSVKIDWTSEHKRKLLFDIQAYKRTNSSVSQTRVLLIGPVGAGKSSFCNSIMSVFNGQIMKPAPTGNSGCTTQFHTYDVKAKAVEGKLPIILCDTMGLEETTGAGLHVGDVSSILRGHVPDRYQFNSAVALQPEARPYKKNPGLQDKIHCVVYVIDANKIKQGEDKLTTIRTKINVIGIPQLVLLTKVEEACPAVAKDLKRVYQSLYIQTKLQEASKLLDVPLSSVLPVKNYSHHTELDQNCDILLLSAVYKMLHFAEVVEKVNNRHL